MRHSIRPDILTSSGVYFDFVNPEHNLILIDDIARGLSNTCRFAGQTREFYSVAQHSVMVSMIVPPEHARAGLMHDAAESFIGDVTRPLKALLPDYRALESRVEAAVLHAYGLSLPFADDVKRADLVMLATEQRDLMPAHSDEWTLILDITPLADELVPLDPRSAERLFLDRWAELFLPDGITIVEEPR